MNSRHLAIGVHDVAVTAVALWASFFLRWGETEFARRIESISLVCLIALPLAAIAYRAARLDRLPWKYVSIADLGAIALAAAVPAIYLALVDFLSRGALVVPRTVPVIYWVVQIFLLAGPRVAYRVYRARRRERRAFRGVYRAPVIVAGTDDEAAQLLRRLAQDTVNPLAPVALLAIRRRHVGETIGGVPIMGELGDLAAVMGRLEAKGTRPKRLIVTRDTLQNAEAIDELLVEARQLGLSVVRSADGLKSLDRDESVQLAPVSIDDLLNRSTREMDVAPARALVAGKRVIVTGAGGSIGSELCRQIAAMAPAELVLLDLSELALWRIAGEIRAASPTLAVRQHLGSVCDRRDLERLFETVRPELVFHAAALKHVDIVEAHPVAAAHTNTLGTRQVAQAAWAIGATHAVFISTDKAVDPVSVLGATKRAGELVWTGSAEASGPTRFVTVRFGNVLGSSGSVIPLFTEQLGRGGPLTVTHPEVERYFMTISEAVRLVLMASALEGDEAAPTFVLDMGRPVRIVDLARRMIRLAGLQPEIDIPIVFTGLRPGERLSEALESGEEELRDTAIKGVRVTASRTIAADRLAAEIEHLGTAVDRHDEDGVRAALRRIVDEYRPARAPDQLFMPAEAGIQASGSGLDPDLPRDERVEPHAARSRV